MIDNAHRYTVDSDTGCWNWAGYVSPTGYGVWSRGGYAHRRMYELRQGPIPAGTEIDHLCRNRRCVNPDHLEPVPHVINAQRGCRSKLTVEAVAEFRRRHAAGDRVSALADEFGIERGYGYRIVNGARWANVAATGERPDHVHLPDDVVRAVATDAALGMSSRALAAKHGIGKTAAWRIAAGVRSPKK